MGSGSATSDFTAEAKFGLRWLLRMWDDETQTFYYQVGIGSGNDHTAGDHDIWRLPQADDTWGGNDPVYRYIRHRPVFRAGPAGSKISPNLAGRDAAALALGYQVFKEIDPPFAARCLLAAEHIFDLADPSPSGDLTTAIPFDFYPETEWRDDMELGATELYFALAGGQPAERPPAHGPAALPRRRRRTGPTSLHRRPERRGRHAEPVRRERARPLRAVSGRWPRPGTPASLETTQAALLADLKKQLDGALDQAASDPFRVRIPRGPSGTRPPTGPGSR